MRPIEDCWWVHSTSAGVEVGLTDAALAQLGPLYFVDCPAVGAILTAGMPFATIEARHWVLTLNAPTPGRVVATNPALTGVVNPPVASTEWLLRLQPADPC